MRLTRRVALTAPLALAACGEGGAAGKIAFTEANDHVVAPVILGGRPTLALLDNGAPLTSVDRSFAANSGLSLSALGGSLDPLDMAFGEARIRIHPFLEDMTEASIATDAPIRVIAGMELFNAYAVSLNYSLGELVLQRRPIRTVEGAVRMRLDDGPPPHPSLEVTINGQRRLRAFVDLGSSAALLVSPRLADEMRLGEGRAVSTRQVILSRPDGLGLSVSRLTSIDSLTLGRWTMRDVPIDILPDDAQPFAGIDAAIGQPLLRRFAVTFDLPGWLHLAANNRLNEPFDRRRTGLQTKPEGAGLRVRHVAKNSPAQAEGFAAGDMIIAIDGAPPLMRTLRQARQDQVLDITLAGGRRKRLTAARYY